MSGSGHLLIPNLLRAMQRSTVLGFAVAEITKKLSETLPHAFESLVVLHHQLLKQKVISGCCSCLVVHTVPRMRSLLEL